MLRFYYNPSFKYTNRQLIDISTEDIFRDIEYINIDSPDTINGHIIYELNAGENIPTYVVDLENDRRYFVTGITQLRTGKFQISLLRDIMSESKIWAYEEAYIEAGLATDYNKYKRWDLPFTNTKIKQERLDINGKSSFFVFYVNEQEISNAGAISEKDFIISQVSVPGYTNYDYSVNNLNQIPYYELVGAGARTKYNHKVSAKIYMYNNASGLANYTLSYDELTNTTSLNRQLGVGHPDQVFNNGIRIYTNGNNVNNNVNNCKADMSSVLLNFSKNNFDSNITEAQINALSDYVDKIIYNQTDNKFYSIRLNQTTGQNSIRYSGSQTGTLLTSIRNINWSTSGGIGSTAIANFTTKDNYIFDNSTYTEYTYTLEELGTATSFSFNFKANVAKLPKSAVRCINIVSSGTVLDSDLARMLMAAQTNGTLGIANEKISDTANVGRILDIQYLPFSVATAVNENIKINGASQVAQFLDVDNFEYNVDLPDLTDINKETDTIKIVSPSRASQFLFRPYNNNGNMLFNCKITIKPYTSTIYVRPSTQGLLISDWDDKDCLIIQEDFSLTNVTSSWTEYVYNNRNYQNAFNRQMQGREVERQWEKKIEQAQAKSDEWTARNISAQKAQTYTGNIPIISGVAGAIGTAWKDSAYMEAAAMDRQYNQAMYEESVSLARDQFSYQLDNLQSQPLIPSSVTTIDAKFLDGVYLEYYSTNSSELEAISYYYRYNGNRIEAYGTFNQYYGWFVRGKIIKSQFYTQPEIDEVNRRLQTGIFTEVQYD